MYGYLRIELRAFAQVRFPDGTSMIVEPGAGEQVASDWRAEQAQAADPEQLARIETLERKRVDEREQALRQHKEELAEWERMHDSALDRARTVPEMREIHAQFLRDNPEPTLDPKWEQTASIDLPDALEIPVPEVSAGRHWVAQLADLEHEEVVLGPEGAYPRAAVARVLTELQGSGWTVVHVTEDRVVAHGEDGASARVSGAWILLCSAP
jgi:hypothetical protein